MSGLTAERAAAVGGRSTWLEVVPQSHFKNAAAKLLVRDAVEPTIALGSKGAIAKIEVDIVSIVLIKRLQRMIEEVQPRKLDLNVLVFGDPDCSG